MARTPVQSIATMKHAIFFVLSVAIPAALSSCGSVSKMKEEKERLRPVLSSISPTQIKQGWTGTLRVTGSRFDSNTYVFIDHGAKIPSRRVLSDTLIEVQLGPDITGSPRDRTVEVRNGEGEFSDELRLVVTPDPSYVPPPPTAKPGKSKKKSTTRFVQ